MIETLGGLPAHPLIVHLPVVLVPLALVAALIMAIRPRWLRTLGPVVAVLAGLGFLGAVVAASTGEALEENFLEAGQTISSTLRDHAESGDQLQWIVGVFFVAMVAWVAMSRRTDRPVAAETVESIEPPTRPPPRAARAVLALSVLAVLSGAVATVQVYRTGHSGATSVWQPEP